MSKTIQEERLRWIRPIINKEMRLVDMAKVCPYSQRSLERWCKAYREKGKDALIPESTIPKTSPNETSIRIKERVIELRKQTGLCAQKLHWRLKKQGLNIPVRTVGKIIKQEGLVRKYRKKKIVYKYIKATRQPGDIIEIDVKYVPARIKGVRYYQYTAIDCATRWRYLKVYSNYGNKESIDFIEELINIAPFRIRAVKTDNGANFTNRYTGYNKSIDPLNPRLHGFDLMCQRYNIIHYLIDPGKPSQNGTVERSHREDQEKFYDRNRFKNMNDLQTKIQLWNQEYNNLEHCGLNGKTPLEFLEEYRLNKLNTKVNDKLIKPPKVCA